MFLKCAGLRWLLIDEISTAGLMVLGILERNTRKACASQMHSVDRDGEERCWGGVNLIVCGDWWQLQAVLQKSICRNPFLRDYESMEMRIRDMFWQLCDETIPHGQSVTLFFDCIDTVCKM